MGLNDQQNARARVSRGEIYPDQRSGYSVAPNNPRRDMRREPGRPNSEYPHNKSRSNVQNIGVQKVRPRNNSVSMSQSQHFQQQRGNNSFVSNKTQNQKFGRKSVKDSKASQPKKKLKPTFIIAAGIALILIVSLVDLVANWGKIMPNIKVGSVDVGGLTISEASEKIEEAYVNQVVNASITVYAKSGINNEQDAQTLAQTIKEEMEAGNAPSDVLSWSITGTEIDASLPSEELAQEAYNAGRGFSGILKRVMGIFGTPAVTPHASYSPTAIEQWCAEIDSQISNPRVDWGVTIVRGDAKVTEGHDGYMIDRDEFMTLLDTQIFNESENTFPSVTYAKYFALRITQEKAQSAADRINAAIGDGVVFEYNGSAWMATPTAVGSWVSVELTENKNEYSLTPSLNQDLAKAALLSYIQTSANLETFNVSFDTTGNEPMVSTDRSGKMPAVVDAIKNLNTALFSDNPDSSAQAEDGVAPEIKLNAIDIPSSMTVQTALDSGLITSFGTFTTEYAVGAGKVERNYNIHLMADLLNNSVCKANGGVWSFNEVGGESNEANGFKSAGSILEGEMIDSIGGGICQVATTIFNSIYNSGYRIVTRCNHSLYIPSYPLGLDCSVSWPDMDFKWANDTESDVLVCMSYTESTVTCTLYGVNPTYAVTSTPGEWIEGDAFETKYIINNSRSSTYNKTTTTGQNGRSIIVSRTVRNQNDKIVYDDQVYSEYKPTTEIIEIGPGTFADQMTAEGKVLRIIDGT